MFLGTWLNPQCGGIKLSTGVTEGESKCRSSPWQQASLKRHNDKQQAAFRLLRVGDTAAFSEERFHLSTIEEDGKKKTVCNCLMAVCSEPTKLARFAILLLSTWWRATQVFLFAQLQIWSCWSFISKSMASMDIHAVSIVSNYQYIWLIQRRDQKMPLCPYISNVSKLFDIFWHILAMFAPVCCSLICRPSYRSDPWEDVLPWDPLAAASIWTMKKHSKSPRWAGHWAIKTLFKCSMHSGKKTWLVSFNAWDILLEDDLPSEIHGFLFFADFWTYTYRIDKHLHIMLHLLHIPPTYIRTISGLSSRYYSKVITLPPSLRGKLLWRCRGGSGRETTHPKSSKDERWWKRSEEFRTSFEGSLFDHFESLNSQRSTVEVTASLVQRAKMIKRLASNAPRPSYDNDKHN